MDLPSCAALRSGFFGAADVAVGHGRDLRAGRELVNEEIASVADADDADPDALVCAEDALERAGRHAAE
jgi:hypothetical protein